MAVDTRQVSTASDSVVSREIHMKSECGLTVVPTLATAPQTASEVVQPKPRDYGYTDSLPTVGECLDSPSIDTPDAGESGIEMAGWRSSGLYRYLRGSGCAADSNICEDSSVR